MAPEQRADDGRRNPLTREVGAGREGPGRREEAHPAPEAHHAREPEQQLRARADLVRGGERSIRPRSRAGRGRHPPARAARGGAPRAPLEELVPTTGMQRGRARAAPRGEGAGLMAIDALHRRRGRRRADPDSVPARRGDPGGGSDLATQAEVARPGTPKRAFSESSAHLSLRLGTERFVDQHAAVARKGLHGRPVRGRTVLVSSGPELDERALAPGSATDVRGSG